MFNSVEKIHYVFRQSVDSCGLPGYSLFVHLGLKARSAPSQSSPIVKTNNYIDTSHAWMDAGSSAILRVEGVYKRFGATVALDGVNFELRGGRFTAFGGEWCGKNHFMQHYLWNDKTGQRFDLPRRPTS
jgi:hypothetical protein